MASRHLAIDIGASSGRAIVGELDETGRLRLTEVHRFENGLLRRNGHLCWDIDALWESVLHGLTAAHEQGLTPTTVGIDTWGVDFVLLDAQDRRLGDAVGYRDARTQGVREPAGGRPYLPGALLARTGIPTVQHGLPALRLKHEHPEQLCRPHAFLMVPDYLNFLLCGEKANEYTNASTTALVGATSRDWDRELHGRLGLPTEIFPARAHAGLRAGPPAPGGRAPCGLRRRGGASRHARHGLGVPGGPRARRPRRLSQLWYLEPSGHGACGARDHAGERGGKLHERGRIPGQISLPQHHNKP